MKKAILFAVMMALTASYVYAETYTVDPEASTVKWYASKVTGKHDGKVKLDSGTVMIENGQLTGGEAVFDVSALTVDDLTGDSNQKLTNHLKSADFFDVENHPKATMKITNVTPAGENKYNVTADVTVKGITHPQTFEAEVTPTDDGLTAKATVTIDRTLYDVRYGSGKFFENLGDRMIHDDFKLEADIVAKKAGA